MSKTKMLLLLVLVQMTTIHAQERKNIWDTILKKDNTSIQCRVLKVTEENIEYKPKGNIPFLVIPRSDVSSIIYADGTVVPIGSQKKEDESQNINLKNVPQEREEVCRNCNGSGIARHACPTCNGSGRIHCNKCQNGRVLMWVIVIGGKGRFENVVCSNCGGTTKVVCTTCNQAGQISSTCSACGGKGKIVLTK